MSTELKKLILELDDLSRKFPELRPVTILAHSMWDTLNKHHLLTTLEYHTEKRFKSAKVDPSDSKKIGEASFPALALKLLYLEKLLFLYSNELELLREELRKYKS